MEKVRLGGMALANGVLVHGPTAWGCAVRLPDGTIKSAAGKNAGSRREFKCRWYAGRCGSQKPSR
jgi:hypothetical protein